MEDKILKFEDLQKMDNEQKITSAKDYWKCLVLGFIVNSMEQGDINYKLTEKQLDNVVENIFSNDTIYEVIDEHISYELMNYETEYKEEEEE